MLCPKPECKQLLYTRDGMHYGVHFSKITDSVPCDMSYKPIPKEEILAAVVVDTESAHVVHDSIEINLDTIVVNEGFFVCNGWSASPAMSHSDGGGDCIGVELRCGAPNVHVSSAMTIEDAERVVAIIQLAISEAKAKQQCSRCGRYATPTCCDVPPARDEVPR